MERFVKNINRFFDFIFILLKVIMSWVYRVYGMGSVM